MNGEVPEDTEVLAVDVVAAPSEDCDVLKADLNPNPALFPVPADLPVPNEIAESSEAAESPLECDWK